MEFIIIVIGVLLILSIAVFNVLSKFWRDFGAGRWQSIIISTTLTAALTIGLGYQVLMMCLDYAFRDFRVF